MGDMESLNKHYFYLKARDVDMLSLKLIGTVARTFIQDSANGKTFEVPGGGQCSIMRKNPYFDEIKELRDGYLRYVNVKAVEKSSSFGKQTLFFIIGLFIVAGVFFYQCYKWLRSPYDLGQVLPKAPEKPRKKFLDENSESDSEKE